jgi:hypothetical protein
MSGAAAMLLSALGRTRVSLVWLAMIGSAGVGWSGAAGAAPALEIRGAAVRVTVIAEARRDIQVMLARPNPALPIRIHRFLDRVYVSGDVGHRVRGCRLPNGRKGLAVWGLGPVPLEQLPELVVHTPLGVRLKVGDAVFGDISRSDSVDFTNLGCGDWVVGDVRGRLRLDQVGAGDTRAGSAGSADLSVGGLGGIAAGAVTAGLTAVSSGSGNIAVAAVAGPIDARVAGSGDIDIAGGSVTTMVVSIAGSGAVRLRGTAERLEASIAGSGDISVSRVTGSVSRQVFGRGVVRIGR